MAVSVQRYSSVAIILHWVMAICFILMLAMGLIMTELDDKALQFQMYQWHKSLGVLLLLSFLVRIGWRLTHKPPALPESIKGGELKAAKAGHWLLYAMMIALPITGWVMVSSSVYGLPTIVFGWFEWPHVPNIAGNKIISDLTKEMHEVLAWMFMLLIVLHVAAVIKHFVVEKENIIKRMWWNGK